MPEFVIFSDLDGTLLDHQNYSFEPASKALGLISSKSIPLILCSSKTRKEIELYRTLLKNKFPFISENGGGIFIPNNYFSKKYDYSRHIGEYNIIEIGTPREKLTSALRQISDKTGIKIKTFSDMSALEIAELTDLDLQTARLAVERDYSEPFVLDDEKYTVTIEKEINQKGYMHTMGGRFHHILGGNDKGKAVRMLTDVYKSEYGDITTLGVGDSLNDLAMLKVVDIPILVQKPDGAYDPRIKLANLIYAQGIGPSGWNSSILNHFMKFE